MDITVEGLTKYYGVQKAVDNISFTVKTGEILGFLGPNGAGKTTTMKILTCYIAASAGVVTVGSHNVADDQEIIKKSIGYLPENNPLYTEMPVMEYLAYVGELQGVSSAMMRERIGEMIRTCGLNEEKHKKIEELSKGYRQRVGLAQAMIHDPEILILDEPTSGLDPNQIVQIRELIKSLGKKKTVILSTHILPEVEATCDRILIINKGSIVADGTAETLRKQAQGQELLTIKIEGGTGDEVITAIQAIDTVEMVDPISKDNLTLTVQSKAEASSVKAIFDLCVSKKWYLLQLTPLETRLEDIFRDLTLN
ncbi:MAG: gliding motility-associated ABC transporter ATP-binding subunit GldA [Bacteroidetes bacterium]|nr:MAG: gliding motility-associated ABC transporter ATP-binding subunit GldA [Bacteroidota bacterium]